MRFIVDILWYKYRVKVFHDFSGKHMGQNAVNTSCRQQLGSCSLPLSGLLDVFCNSPKIFRHSLQPLFFCSFFLVQQPDAVFLMQIQRSPVQITPGQDNVSILARSLALHDPCGVRCAHQTIGTGNLVEGVRCCLLTQMVNQQNTDAVLICKGFQRTNVLVVTGVHTATLVAGTDFLQGINDYQPGIRMVVKKAGNLFLQALPNARTFGLQNQPLRGILTAHKPEQTVLQTVEGVLQREIQHRARLNFPTPHRLTLCDLQAKP